MKKNVDKIYGAIFGVAIGDAVGVPAEFRGRDYYKDHPVTDMIGGGFHNQPAGTWSDDTSMTLATIDGLFENMEEPDYEKIMSNYLAWAEHDEYTAGGRLFDIGGCCSEAIWNYENGTAPIDCGPDKESSCGNGALMRILPSLFWLENKYGRDFIDIEEARRVIDNLTSLTHGHARCKVGSGIYLAIADAILNGGSKEEAVVEGRFKAYAAYIRDEELKLELEYYDRVCNKNMKRIQESVIRSSGYVVDTLEAAVWAFLNTDNYRDCILKAVNLGDDTDTVAAVAGGLAGLYYGLDGIQMEWRQKLVNGAFVEKMCEKITEELGC